MRPLQLIFWTCLWATCALAQKTTAGQNQIEGELEKGQKVVVVEDLISTGGSVIEVVNVLQRRQAPQVLGIVSIFTYGMTERS